MRFPDTPIAGLNRVADLLQQRLLAGLGEGVSGLRLQFLDDLSFKGLQFLENDPALVRLQALQIDIVSDELVIEPIVEGHRSYSLGTDSWR